MQRVTNSTRTTAPPTAAPAMMLTLLVDEGLGLDVDEALDILDGRADAVDEGADAVDEGADAVDEGADTVDDGELAPRHEASFDVKTCWMSESPPVLPWESVIENNMFVPALTSTTQV